MFPTINGKDLLDCNEDNLQSLVGDPDYRESEFLDYKQDLPFITMENLNPKRADKLAEFRSDVCSFANAQGGYILFGISENKGVASKICGIDIPNGNTDQFQLDRNNNLQAIMPKLPSVKFKFVKLQDGKYVVILFIQPDDFSPYVHLENDRDYRICKRIGNGKRSIPYPELKQLFMQSQSLSESILAYRRERISYFRSQEDTPDLQYSRFMLLHIIPDTFRDTSHNKNMFYLSRKFDFSGIFSKFGLSVPSRPNVDGLRFIGDEFGECLIGNNGIAECFYPLHRFLHEQGTLFPTTKVWEQTRATIPRYIDVMRNVIDTNRIFIGVSVLGCKGITTERNRNSYCAPGHIDRQSIICNPIVINDIHSEDDVKIFLNMLLIELTLALGIQFSETLRNTLDEVYHDKL